MNESSNIPIRNIYYMLAYAFRSLRLDTCEDLAAEDFDHIHDLFAAVLSKGITRLIKQGPHRDYQLRTENLTTVRGKIDLPETLKNSASRLRTAACAFDELSENTLLNQILKTTVSLLLKHGEVSRKHRAELRKVIPFLTAVDELDPASIRWNSIRFQRNTVSYKALIGICYLVMRGLLLSTEKGRYSMARILDDQRMSLLYEKFLLGYFSTEWAHIQTSSPQIGWALDDGFAPMLPVMRTDVMLSRGHTALIIDAKYYSHILQTPYKSSLATEGRADANATVRSANLYQIFAYVKNMQANPPTTGYEKTEYSVSGLLLYAGTNETIQPDVTYHMSGNRISVQTLDLRLPFKEIRTKLDDIVKTHFQ